LKDLFAGGPLGVYRPFDEYSDSGAIGAPELASADKGRELAAEIVSLLATLLHDIHERNRDTR
jgi:creatinine amidohydrolase